MQVQLQFRRTGHSSQYPITSGSRILVLSHAKRKGVSRELQELQYLKEFPAPPAPAPTTPSPVTPSTSASVPAATSPAASAVTTTAAATVAVANGGGVFDSLLFRILASVTAIMMVIGIFYSIVFYGASNAVYVFKDQLSAITKKDFVPYSERRRMEQEVLAKLEAELADKQRARDEAAALEGAGSSGQGSPAPAAAQDDAGSSSELLNLLPSSKKP